jgi:hypothetical protein
MQQYRENMIPRDETVSFPQVAGNNAALLARAAGTPLAWPANWIFARAHQLPASQYDRAVGQYLFYRQNNLGGVIDLGDPRVDPSLLDEGWSARTACEDAVCRGIDGRARVFAPLDVPEDLDVTLRVRGSGTLRVAVNGVEVTQSPLTPALADLRLRVPRAFWKRELNEIALGVDERAEVDKLVFVRTGARR